MTDLFRSKVGLLRGGLSSGRGTLVVEPGRVSITPRYVGRIYHSDVRVTPTQAPVVTIARPWLPGWNIALWVPRVSDTPVLGFWQRSALTEALRAAGFEVEEARTRVRLSSPVN